MRLAQRYGNLILFGTFLQSSLHLMLNHCECACGHFATGSTTLDKVARNGLGVNILGLAHHVLAVELRCARVGFIGKFGS